MRKTINKLLGIGVFVILIIGVVIIFSTQKGDSKATVATENTNIINSKENGVLTGALNETNVSGEEITDTWDIEFTNEENEALTDAATSDDPYSVLYLLVGMGYTPCLNGEAVNLNSIDDLSVFENITVDDSHKIIYLQ